MYSSIQNDKQQIERPRIKKRNRYVLFLFFFLVVTSTTLVLFLFITASPNVSSESRRLYIEKGMSVREITNEAYTQGIVRSSLVLYALLSYSYEPTSIYAGVYTFDAPANVFAVAQKLANSEIDQSLLTITITEGVTRKEIASIAGNVIPNFDTATFLELSKNHEGYLFPDTYFVSEDFTPKLLVDLLTTTFAESLAPFTQRITESKFTEYEVLTLASILEREANDEESMKMVSGILQNRLEIGMALQTDATIGYVLGKPLKDLSPADLDIDTPYNTYLYPKLPPTPIGNPGLTSIQAVLEPTQSEYMYYITGDDGTFHYAKTFEEHKRNIAKYLLER